MRRHITPLAAYLLLCLPLFVGCDSTPADRVEFLRDQTSRAETLLAELDQRLPLLERSLADMQALLADPAIDEATRQTAEQAMAATADKIEQVKTARAAVADNLLKINQAIATLQAGGEISQWDELQFYGAVGQQIGTQIPPPWGGYVVLGSSLLTLIGGLLGGKYKQQLDDKERLEFADRTTVELVYSVDKLLEALPDEQQAAAKAALKSAQSPDTRAVVMDIKG